MARQGLGDGIPAMTYHQAVRGMEGYDLAVIDEVQDVPADALRRICAGAKQVILAGDETQRIFEAGATRGELTGLIQGNDHRLTRAYRLMPQVHAAASALYPTALEGVQPSGRTRVDIRLYKATTVETGNEIGYKIATDEARKGRTAAILRPTKDSIVDFANWALAKEVKPSWTVVRDRFGKPDFDALNQHLQQHAVPMQIVQNNYGDIGDAFRKHQVVLQTYHSSKGLDYSCVCLPNVAVEQASSDAAFQKALFFVAITRASGALIITQGHTSRSSFVEQIMPFCTQADPARILTTQTDDDDEF